MGFHIKKIEKGTYGEFSKIEEEFEEIIDAFEQNQDLMLIIELSDMIGAIYGYINKQNMNLNNVSKLNEILLEYGDIIPLEENKTNIMLNYLNDMKKLINEIKSKKTKTFTIDYVLLIYYIKQIANEYSFTIEQLEKFATLRSQVAIEEMEGN